MEAVRGWVWIFSGIAQFGSNKKYNAELLRFRRRKTRLHQSR